MTSVDEANTYLTQFGLEIQIKATHTEAELWGIKNLGKCINTPKNILIFSTSEFDLCIHVLQRHDNRMCIYKYLLPNKLTQNNLYPSQNFYCSKSKKQDNEDVLSTKEDRSNLLAFQTRSTGFVCDFNVGMCLMNSSIFIMFCYSYGEM